MILLIIGVCLIGMVSVVLISPLVIWIDSAKNEYEVRWKGIGRMIMVPDQDKLFILRLRIFFLEWRFLPFSSSGIQQREKSKEKGSTAAEPVMGRKISLRTLLRMLRSFHVQELEVEVDTGDYVRNAYLYPLFYFLSDGRKQWLVNYKGINRIRMVIQNRPIRMLYAAIR